MVELHDVGAAERDAAPDDVTTRARVPQRSQGDCRFPCTGFANQRHHLAPIHFEADVLDDGHVGVVWQPAFDPEIVDLQQSAH